MTMADVAHPLTRRAEHLDAPSRGPDEDSRDGPGGADPYRNGRGVTNLGNSVPLSLRAKSPRSHPYHADARCDTARGRATPRRPPCAHNTRHRDKRQRRTAHECRVPRLTTPKTEETERFT